KASNTGADDRFGSSVALSVDGSTLAVGARSEASNATGVNGTQTDNSAFPAGAVYVFTR
ncbi:MAG: integrin, partial [Myxococcaceae bacterium]|nr:integrin [Myxococcaceae bacterium]